MSIGNDVVSSDFLKVLLALKDNIMRDLHCNDIGIVVSTSGNECVCKLLSNPDIKISCTKINNIITDKDDVVFIAYTDINSKHNAKQLSDQKDLRNQTIGNKHAYENAVIVLNYSKQGSGEGVTVDSAFSTTSTNALQNKVITNRFNQVESRLINVDSALSATSTNPVQNKVITNRFNQVESKLINVDSALSATSTNPVQNKVLYNPVDFAESERQKSKNLFPYSTITGTEFYQQYLNTPIKAGTYTISALVSSSDTDSDLSSIVFEDEDKLYPKTVNLSRNSRSSTTFTINQDCYYVTFFASYSYVVSTGDTFTFSDIQIEEGSVATDYQPYNGEIVHEKEIEITIGDATLNTNVVSSGEVSWVKLGKLVVVSFSDIKFKGSIAHQNLYFSGLPKKAIKSQTFLLHQMNAHGGSSLRCMMQKDSTQIINWYQDTTLDTNAQYYGQFTYITDEN